MEPLTAVWEGGLRRGGGGGGLHCCIHGNPPCTSDREPRHPETETKQSERKTETERDEAD